MSSIFDCDHQPQGSYKWRHPTGTIPNSEELDREKGGFLLGGSDVQPYQETVQHKTTIGVTRFEWTTKSFNERTGNKCQEFRRNRLQAPDF